MTKLYAALALAAFGLAGCSKTGNPFAQTGRAPVCLASYQIYDTERPDDSTIRFVMRDRSVYVNHLPQRCVGLSNDPRGFTYEPTNPGTDEICDNLVTIRLNTYGETCLLGAFTPVSPPPPR
jgi:hypothetical protein